MPRADSGYPHNFMVNSWVLKDDESKSDAKTNSRHRVCLLLFGSLLLARRVHAQSPLLAQIVRAQSPLLAQRVRAQSPLLAHCVNTQTNQLHITSVHASSL